MQSKRILIVDDDVQIVALVRLTLERSGFDVVTALDGKQGLAKLNEENPDLVIVDISMPYMDGYEFIETIRNTDGALGRLPIMILSAHQQDVMRTYAKEMGADLYLVKPISPKKLVENVKRLLNGDTSTKSAEKRS